MSNALDAVRELHTPYSDGYSLNCEGCPGDSEWGQPGWPCPTAGLVYTEAEIAEATEAFALEQLWRKQRRWQKPPLGTSGIGALVRVAWERYILDALRSSPIIDKVVSTQKIGGTVRVSNEMLT